MDRGLHKTEKRRAARDEREAVLLALLSYEKRDTFSNVLVKRTLDDCGHLSVSERAFIKRLLEGVIERKTELDAVIERYTGRSVSRLHPALHQILRMGIYQILYMDAVPDSAACNEAVRLAKKHGPARLSGFVNGVLRNAARDEQKRRRDAGAPEKDGGDAQADSARDEQKDRAAALWPKWLTEMWTRQLGEEETKSLLDELTEIRPVSIRLCGQPSRGERERILEALKNSGVLVEKGKWHPDHYLLRKTSDLTKLPGFSQGLWTVQDAGSMLAVEAAGLQGGETVYDVCAAPGGKSFFAAQKVMAGGKLSALPAQGDCRVKMYGEAHILDELSTTFASRDCRDQLQTSSNPRSLDEEGIPCGRVCSFDLTSRKTAKIREGARRLHLSNILVRERDALQAVPPDEEGAADVLLCDLPCSGLGVMGKKRDIKYRASLEGIEELQKLQRRILQKAVSYLKKGGVLIYSTCTVSRAENEENAAFIEKELGLAPDPLAPFLPEGIPKLEGNMIQLLPHIHGTDGFFIARFVKK